MKYQYATKQWLTRLCFALLLLLAFQLPGVAQSIISTVAGDGTNTGTGTSTGFTLGVAVDPAGNIYVAGGNTHVIRKITPGGTYSTIAGTGTLGFAGDGGQATSAQLNAPSDVFIINNNLYIADVGNRRIRKVDLGTGVITSVAGDGTTNITGGGIGFAQGVAADAAGNVYVATGNGHVIRKITTGGVYSNFVGTGTAGFGGDGGQSTSAQVNSPADIFFSSNALYIADLGNRYIRKVDLSTNVITTVAGDGTTGITGNGIGFPNGVAVDAAGNILVAAGNGHTIRKITPGGVHSTVAGTGTAGFSGDGGPATSAQVASPIDMSALGNDIYIADRDNYRIRKVTNLVVTAPTVTTAAATSITSTSAVLGGNVTADGGAAVTDRGVVYSSTNTTPTIGNGTQNSNSTTGTGSFSENITGLTASTTYYVQAYATNAAGTSYGAPISFTTRAPVSGTTVVTNVSCNGGSNGTINLTPTGGVAPYTFLWNTGQTTEDRTGLSAGAYSVTITDATGATGTVNNIIVTQPSAISASTVQTNIACNGGSTGAASVSPTGGTSPYTYLWSTGATTQSISGLAAGSYSVTITDVRGCTRTYSFTITQPAALTATTSQSNVTTNGGNNGSATITVSGGTPSYTYSWSPNVSTTATASNLSAGTYSVTATDANGCTITRSFTITQPAAVTVTSVTRLTPSPAATAQVRYQVVFSGSVSGVTISNFNITNTGTVSGTSISSTVGSGTTYTVTVNTGTGSGTLRLNVNNSAGITPTVSGLPFNGEVYTITRSFAAQPQLTIVGTGGTGSDVTAFVDVVQVLSGGSAFANALQNGSFEQHDPLSNGDFGYQPTSASWTFNAQAGIAESGSAFTPITPIPNGIAVAFLQSTNGGNGQIQQNLALPNGSNYQVNFQAAQRVCCTTLDQSLNVFLNGVYFGNIQPNENSYSTFTSPAFSVTAPALTATVSTTSASPTSTAPIPFSVTFSQSVGTTFTASDVTVTGGTLNSGSFSGSGTSYTFTVAPSGTGTVSVSLAANVAQDANNTGNTASNTLSVQYTQPATAAPVITSPTNGTLTNQPVAISGTAPAGSEVEVFVSQNGAAFQSIGTSTATGGTFTSVTIPYPSASYQAYATAQSPGAAVSANSATISFIIDTVQPTVAITSTAAASGGTTTTTPIPFTVTFSENVTGFVAGDVTVTNGTIGTVSGSGTTYTFNVTPTTAGTATTVNVPANVAVDQAGNGNTGSNTYALTFTAPTITVAPASLPNGTVAAAYSQTITASGGTAPYTFAVTAGALPTGLTLATNGTLSGTPTASGPFTFTVRATDASAAPGPYSGSRSYTLTIGSQPVTAAPVVLVPGNNTLVTTATPTYAGTAPAASTVTVYVDGANIGTVTANNAGNWALSQPSALTQGSHTVYATAQTSGSAVSANSNTNTFTVDTVRPSVAISSSTAANNGTSGTTPFAYTVTFSEAVTGFVAGDVSVNNGTISGFAGSGTTYTFNVTPAANGAVVAVNVPANVAQDQAGNGNTAAPSAYTITYSQPVTATPVVTVPTNGSLTNTTTPTYAGTAVANATVTVYVDGTSIGTTTADGTGSFTLAQPTALAQGSHTVYATAQTSGSTVSANSNTNTFTVDSVQPSVAISSTAGTSGSNTTTTPIPFTATFSEIVTGFSASGISVTNGTVTSGPTGSGTTYTFTVTPTTAGTATTVTVAANAAQDAATNGNTVSNTYSLTYQLANVVWNGSLSTDWFTAGNWTPAQVPTSTTNVTIPVGAPNMPLITGTGTITAFARNLAINSGATLTQTGNNITLTLTGNLTNNGTYAASGPAAGVGSTLSLGTTALGSILGSSNTRFWNLAVGANGAQLSTSASTSVQRILTLNGNLATNGNPLTLESNAANTALVVNNAANVISGNVTAQRYIDPILNSGLGYRHYSAPIANATVGSLATASFTPVVNPTYNTSATPNSVRPFPTVYFYDQARVATATNNNLAPFDRAWTSPSALTDPLTVGKGYTVNLAAQTLAVTGTLNNGDVAQALASNRNTQPDGGWQLLGNPYPAPLDYSRVISADRPGLDAAIYVYQSTGQYVGQYRSYVVGIGNPILPSGQAFFTRVATGQPSGSLTLRNSYRLTTVNNTAFLRTAETRPLVQLTLQGATGVASDEAYVYFDNAATAGFDGEKDAMKLANPTGLNLASWAGSDKLAINGLPLNTTTSLTVPLFVGVPATGTYTMRAAQVLNFGAGQQPFLRDLQLGTLTDLSLNPDYTFTMNAANTAARFELVFGAKVLGVASAKLAAQVAVYPNPASKAVFVELPFALNRKAVTAALVDGLGRVVLTQALPAGQPTYTLPLTNLATGVYSLRLQTEAGVVVKKLVVE